MSEIQPIAKAGKIDLVLLPTMANRHGLITGATGTGKTVTLQKIIETFSLLGVPCVVSDIKGDLSGIAKAGGEKLFGSITNIDIAAALASAGQEIDRKFITSGIVKRIGKYSASIRLHRDVIVEIPYEIVPEKA